MTWINTVFGSVIGSVTEGSCYKSVLVRITTGSKNWLKRGENTKHVGGRDGSDHGSVSLLIVHVRQQGLFPHFLQKNDIKSSFEMVQEKRDEGLFFRYCGSPP